ncbi:diaminopimelate decarboxylase [Aurantimicrobium sp. MWH-Uga1]|uniref:diaminopimelate decarboxylase n=1 Tax=Aurantimicrobium sp. MWH-Uga1 TaxID=2079575 RepID=UPI000DEE0245|nr:diaminopimelate decarboxylase [Aurantimicrobium sp. MWH-Uga1]AXE54889.1 Diaminopimelate decarboxylase [Aurantimicrobium sp. MWH-Uga1]
MASHPLAPTWLNADVDANELVDGVWASSVTRNSAGEVLVAGAHVSTLAQDFGTPLYVIDEAHARNRAVEVRNAFELVFTAIGTRAKVYYAGKAFLCTEVVRWVAEAGLNVDVASGGELAVALAAGIDPSRVGLHGNNKSQAEIERAVDVGVGTIVIDSFIEIGRIADAARRAGKKQRVRLRVNSGVHAHTHSFLATAHEDQKFGVTISDAPDLVAEIRSHESLEFVGLHCHIGSQIFGTDGFAESAARLLALHAELLKGGPVPELNLGGGFGIAYTPADKPTSIEEIAQEIASVVSAECSRLGIDIPVICVEPGRAVIGTSTFTLYEVGTVKDVSVDVVDDNGAPTGKFAIRKYVSVDGGMSDNARPALYGADYSVRIANRVSDAEPALVRIAGKHCESGDILVYADYLPGDVKPGDLLAIPATGAYCWSLSSNYNYLTRPPVVAVKDGVARVIVRGETEEDLLARDMGVIRKVNT